MILGEVHGRDSAAEELGSGKHEDKDSSGRKEITESDFRYSVTRF